jgi:hypothetical protein
VARRHVARFGIDGDAIELHVQGAAARHRVAGIHREVHQHLLELHPIRLDGAGHGGGAQFQPDALADQARQHVAGVREHGVEVQRADGQHLLASEREAAAA